MGPMGKLAKFDIFDERLDLGSVIAASQLPGKSWHARVGDNTIADAIIDRSVCFAENVKEDG